MTDIVRIINVNTSELEDVFDSYPKWLDDAFEKGIIDIIFFIDKDPFFEVRNNGETMRATQGDYISRQQDGELKVIWDVQYD